MTASTTITSTITSANVAAEHPAMTARPIAAVHPETTSEALPQSRRWLGLAIMSLVLAGLLAVVLVIGRVPPLDSLFTDPLFFRRALVVHVDLAIVVWFLGFFAALWFLLPTRQAPNPIARAAPILALAGITMMVSSSVFPGVAPILANYVPVLDSPLFLAGLALFFIALLVIVLDARISATREDWSAPAAFIPPPVRPGLRAAGLAVIVAALTFIASLATTPTTLPADAYYEVVVWGGGHVLQFTSVAAMLAVWLTLLTPLTGPPLSRRVTSILFGVLVLPLAAAPIMADTNLPESRIFFTRLMELGLFPVTTIVLVACIVALVRARRRPDSPAQFSDGRVLGFLASATLTLVGFALGASIDGSNTMVPAHYHASIGAVTAAFMTIAHPLCTHLGLAPHTGRAARIARLQPVVFAIGQLIFVAGFAIAGAAGMARKTYGAEQVVITDASAKTVGLVVMGVGGAIAVVGGIAFMWLVIRSWRARRGPRRPPVPAHT